MSDQTETIDPITLPFEERAEALLSKVFRGIHHCGKIEKTPLYWTTNHHGDIATFDFDDLTRLVLAAHHWGIRASIKQAGPRALKIVLHKRKSRDGCSMFDRHPTIEQAREAIGL